MNGHRQNSDYLNNSDHNVLILKKLQSDHTFTSTRYKDGYFNGNINNDEFVGCSISRFNSVYKSPVIDHVIDNEAESIAYLQNFEFRAPEYKQIVLSNPWKSAPPKSKNQIIENNK